MAVYLIEIYREAYILERFLRKSSRFHMILSFYVKQQETCKCIFKKLEVLHSILCKIVKN